MAASNIRYGLGVTQEVGKDFCNIGAKNVALFTDAGVRDLVAVKTAEESLRSAGINVHLYDRVRVEPKDSSLHDAIDWTQKKDIDAFLAVGGGSVMDTAKVANLFKAYPDADFMDFVNPPIGKGLPILRKLSPLIAVPTTAGTGSETSGVAIFDLESMHAKTGFANRALKPLLGIVDPLNTQSMPRAVVAASGLDVLCHSMESYTAIPYYERTPRPSDPKFRPAYQGANPISDVWSMKALQMVVKYLPRAVHDADDKEARDQMILASTFAGIGFGNAGVHLCHGCSYPISGFNKNYLQPGYELSHPLIPHGVSVAVTAPAVFKFTGPSNPERHLEVAAVFGKDVSNAKRESAGEILSEAIKEFLQKLGDQPMGIKKLGYTSSDIDKLVEGTLPQRRVLDLAPGDVNVSSLHKIFEESLEY